MSFDPDAFLSEPDVVTGKSDYQLQEEQAAFDPDAFLADSQPEVQPQNTIEQKPIDAASIKPVNENADFLGKMYSATTTLAQDPTVIANQYEMAKKAGVSFDVASLAPDELQQKLSRPDYESMTHDAPKTSKFLAGNSAMFQLTRDDAPFFANVEKIRKAEQKVFGAGGLENDASTQAAAARGVTISAALWNKIQAEMGSDLPVPPDRQAAILAVAKQIGTGKPEDEESNRAAIDSLGELSNREELILSAGIYNTLPRDRRSEVFVNLVNDGDYAAAGRYAMENGLGIVANMLTEQAPIMGATAYTGGLLSGVAAKTVTGVALKGLMPYAVSATAADTAGAAGAYVGSNFVSNAAITYPSELAGNLAQGMSESEASSKAAASAIGEGTGNALVSALVPNRFGGKVLKTVMETAKQGAGGALGAYMGNEAVGQKTTLGELAAESIFEIAGAPLDFSSEVASGVFEGRQEKIFSAARERDIANHKVGAIMSQLEEIKKAKTAKIAPQSIKELLDGVDGDEQQEVFITPSSLFQGSGSKEALLQAAPSVAGQIDEALRTGGMVRVPLNELLVNTANMNNPEFEQELMRHVKTSPDMDSLAELDTKEQKLSDDLIEMANQQIARLKNASELKEKQDALRKQIQQDLSAVGDQSAVDKASQLWAAMATATAARTGMEPMDLYRDQFRGKVFRQSAPSFSVDDAITSAVERVRKSAQGEDNADTETLANGIPQFVEQLRGEGMNDAQIISKLDRMQVSRNAEGSLTFDSVDRVDDGKLNQDGDTENKNSVDIQRESGVVSNGEVNNYAASREISLESRLEQWRTANGLHDRRGTSAVEGELGEAAETEGNYGRGENPLAYSSKETIERESRELIARAKQGDFFLTPDDIYALIENSESMKGGTEHDIHYAGDDDNAIIIRNTKDGTYGYLDGASPTQYLRRLARNNQVFPKTPIYLLGVSEGKDGEAVIWTAQPFVKGKTYDNERKFNMAMSDHGWEPYNRPNSYIHKETGTVIRDASKANVLYVGDELFPIDVIVEKLPQKNTLYQTNAKTAKQLDAEYMAAVERGDMETAQSIVDSIAAQKGYSGDAVKGKMQHSAPNSHDGFSVSLDKLMESDMVPADYWTHPKYYQHTPEDFQSFRAVTAAMKSEDGMITVYRSIPTNAKDTKFRNGDWVTPSRQYAENEGAGYGNSKIIQERVSIKDLYWNGDSINELGFDNGKSAVYADTKNNRKLAEAVVRDSDGNIVPPSKRFNKKAIEEYFQKNESNAPRGQFDVDTRDITLLAKADLSTFLHESGHLFLEIMTEMAAKETASESLTKDIDATLKWFGIEGDTFQDRLDNWNKLSREEKRPHHEKWAESFEQYLFEGKAPSVELRDAFRSFRQWLGHVYKSIKQFISGHDGAALNDDVRGVFDRMLATEEQIQIAEEARGMLPIFDKKTDDMTDAEWQELKHGAEQATQSAVEQLSSRALRDMKWLSNAKGRKIKALQREARELRREARIEARTKVLGQPIYRAWQFLAAPVEGAETANKKAKQSAHVDPSRDSLFAAIAKLGGLNKAEAVSQYGIDPSDYHHKSGIFGKPILRVDGGLSPDAMAEALSQYGYLPLDEHGKWDIHDLGDLLLEEAAGNPQYSTDADMDVLLGEPQRAFFDAENVEYMGGRINRIDIRNMFDDIQLAEMAAMQGGAVDTAATLQQQGKYTPDLFVAHNLTAENLKHADELGGLAAPSLGVSRTTTGGFTGFGEITLLADKSMLTDRDARTFDADVYSPRHPKAIHKIDNGAVSELESAINSNQGKLAGMNARLDTDSLERRGLDELMNNEAFKNYYLVQSGIVITPKQKNASNAVKKAIKRLDKTAKHDSAYSWYNLRDEGWFLDLAKKHYAAEFEKLKDTKKFGIREFTPEELIKYGPFEQDGSLKSHLPDQLAREVENYHKTSGQDYYANRAEIDKKFRSTAIEHGFIAFAEAEFAKISKEKRLVKYTKNGNAKYSPYNLENIVAEMTRELQGGEGFNYGAGSVRSAFAFEFKHNTIESIKAHKGGIVSKEEMSKIRDEANNRLSDALDKLKKHYKYDAHGFGYVNDASSAIAEGAKGQSEAFRMNAESKAIIKDLIDYLRALPSEYFETKMQRAVGIGEFKAAIVPKGTDQSVIDILQHNGIQQIEYYKKGDGEARTKVIAKQKDLLFQPGSKDNNGTRTLESMGVLSDDGIQPDLVADAFGFPSVEAMVKALLTAPDPLSEIRRVTDEIMLQRHGDLATPEAIEAAASEAVYNKARERLLATELTILNRAIGKPRMVMAQAKEYAKMIVGATKIRDMRPAQYEASATKAGFETLDQLKKGNTNAAAMAKRNQILHTATVKAMREAQAKVDKELAFIAKVEKAARSGKLRAETGKQVIALLERFDLRKGTTLRDADLAERSLSEYLQEVSNNLEMPLPPLSDAVKNGNVRQSYKNMTMDEFSGLVDAVKVLNAVGRREHNMYKAIRNQTFAQERDAILSRIREYWPDAFDEEGNPLPTENAILKTGAYNAKKKARSVAHELLTPETVTNILEGGVFGQVHESLFARLSNAMTDRSILMKELHEKLQPFMDAYTWKERREFGKKDIGTAAIGEPLSRENALVAALLAGNKEGRDRLANYGWNDARIAQVVNLLDAKDIALANAIFDMFDNTLWPKLEALNKRTIGVSPPKVLPIALQAKNGTLTGGYFPIRYDGDMDARSSSFDDKQALDLMKNGIGLSAKTNQSSSQARVDGVKMRPLLSLSVMSKVAGETAHDIALREAVMESARLLNNAEIAQGIQNIVGMEGWKSLKKNLGDIASPPHEAGGMFASAANFARRNVVTSLMSGVGTAVQNFTGLFPAFARVHKGLLLKEIADVPHLIEKYKDTIEKSAYMRERFGKFERDLVNDVDKLGMKKGLMPDQSVWFAMMAWIDRAVSVPVWQAAYREGAAKGVDAVEYADHIVRQTQGGGRLIDRAPIMRGGALQQLFTMFYSYFNGQLNMVARDAALAKREVAQGEVSKAAARLAASAIFVWILPAVISELTRQAPDDEDDEEKLQRVARATILYPTAMIPLLRDFAPFVYDKIAGNRAFDPRLTPVQGFVSTLSRAATAAGDIGSDDFDEKDFKALMMGVGFTFNLPAILFTDVVLGTKALLNGETDDIRAPLIGMPPKS